MLVVIAVTLVVVFVFKLKFADDAEVSLPIDALPADVEKREVQNETQQKNATQDSVQKVTTFPDASRLLLIEDCPEILNPSVIQDQACMDAVERHFSERATYTLEFVGVVPRNGRFSYRETLENVESDRELIIEALSRPECQLLDGPIRLELREMCNADAIFRYSHFVAMCNESTHWVKEFELRPHPAYEVKRSPYQDTLRRFERRVEDAFKVTSLYRPENFDPIEEYYDERNEYRENLLKEVWRTSTGKCPQIVSEPIIREADLGRPRSAMLDWWLQDPTREHDISKLRHVAARLGFERELLNTTCRFQGRTPGRYARYGCLGKEYEESRRSLHPWSEDLADGIDSFSFIYFDDEILPGFERASVLIRLSRGLASMEDSGFEADIEWVTNFICEKRRSVKEDCQAGIERAEKYFDASNTGAFRMLDRIAAKAIELNLYQEY